MHSTGMDISVNVVGVLLFVTVLAFVIGVDVVGVLLFVTLLAFVIAVASGWRLIGCFHGLRWLVVWRLRGW